MKLKITSKSLNAVCRNTARYTQIMRSPALSQRGGNRQQQRRPYLRFPKSRVVEQHYRVCNPSPPLDLSDLSTTQQAVFFAIQRQPR